MRLPWDTGERAALPIGTRIEFVARGAPRRWSSATAPGCRAGVRRCASWPTPSRSGRATHCVAETTVAPHEEGRVRLQLPRTQRAVHHPSARDRRRRWSSGCAGVGGAITPAPPGRAGWCTGTPSRRAGGRPGPHTPGRPSRAAALGPGHGEPRLRGRRRGANSPPPNSSRGCPPTCSRSRSAPTAGRRPFSATLMYETLLAFVRLVRRGHPSTPLLLVSPLLHPEAEGTPNALGATLAQLRGAMEDAARRADARRRRPSPTTARARPVDPGPPRGRAAPHRRGTCAARRGGGTALAPHMPEPPRPESKGSRGLGAAPRGRAVGG